MTHLFPLRVVREHVEHARDRPHLELLDLVKGDRLQRLQEGGILLLQRVLKVPQEELAGPHNVRGVDILQGTLRQKNDDHSKAGKKLVVY